MQVDVIEVIYRKNKNGDDIYEAVVMGRFDSFGTLKMSTVEVKLDEQEYKIMKTKEGQKIDLDFYVPKPAFPIRLVENQFGAEAKNQQK